VVTKNEYITGGSVREIFQKHWSITSGHCTRSSLLSGSEKNK